MGFKKFLRKIIKLWRPYKSQRLPSNIFEEEAVTKKEKDFVRIIDVKIDKEPQTYLFGRPTVCPKCNYTTKYILAHEDGWQCFNCMKIIYKDKPLPMSHHSKL